MKNFSAGKSTIIGQIEEGAIFEKIGEYVGSYDQNVFTIHGYLKTRSQKFNKEQYSLYVNLGDRFFLLNVPDWYGIELEKDFMASDETAEQYFTGASIKTIESKHTKFGNGTHNITIW